MTTPESHIMTTAQVRQLLKDERAKNGKLVVNVWLAFAPGVGEWRTVAQRVAEDVLARVTSDCRYNASAEDGTIWIECIGAWK